jgi:hypothetical protein
MIYSTSFLNLNFFWDDERFIFMNPTFLQAPSWLSFWNFKSDFYKSWPLGYSIFWFLVKTFPSQGFIFYKSINILVHSLNSYLVFRILKKFQFRFSLYLALIFLIHPLHVETVSWVFQLLTLASFSFFLISFEFFINFVQKKDLKYFLASSLFYLFSIWTKGSALMAPVLFVAYYFIENKITKSSVKKSFIFIPLFIIALINGLINISGTSAVISKLDDHSPRTNQIVSEFFRKIDQKIYSPPVEKIRQNNETAYFDFTFYQPSQNKKVTFDHQQIFSQASWHYLYKALLPINLQFIYPQSSGHLIVSIAALIIIFILPLILAYKRDETLWVLVAVMNTVFLVPYLGFTDIAFYYWSSVSDRYTYFFLFSFVFAIAILLKNISAKSVSRSFIVAFILLAVLNVYHGMKFNTPLKLYTEILEYKKHPIIYSLTFEQYYLKLDVANAEKIIGEASKIFPDDRQVQIDQMRLKSLKTLVK